MDKSTTYKNVAGFRCLQNIHKQTSDLYLVHCGHHKCPPEYSYDHKIPNEYHLHFVLNGKGIIDVNGILYPVQKDDIFIILKNVPFKYASDQYEPWEYIWVTFDGTQAENYLNYIGFTVNNPVISSAVPTKVYFPTVQKMLDTNELTFANEIKRVGFLFKILGNLVEAQNTLKNENKRYDYSSDAYVEYALQYIKYNYDHITVNDIAKYIGINRSYLTSIFKKKLNVPPQKYLIDYKLKKAEILIINTNLSIQDIAAKVGYDNPLTFSKIFKQTYNLSPKNYRDKQTAIVNSPIV
ncbi:MAG TPA: AraC family transcriptional regulator [Epulopiscium sp.]|nr:AraC family transcriptional regulator [Candidatus Epulonipiscium sp.]